MARIDTVWVVRPLVCMIERRVGAHRLGDDNLRWPCAWTLWDYFRKTKPGTYARTTGVNWN